MRTNKTNEQLIRNLFFILIDILIDKDKLAENERN